ncbi:hypothetical protein AAFF_G00183680 [Aldrovandia affinis]|uniref:Uncharacterized protein n=1 Tax=Aldrovandia affinis TaxID=143900 RepID=A0AAD7RKE4_9TELE|nr:hypothetical protein AAFF_G00183680 [Aldrovandia affinis]
MKTCGYSASTIPVQCLDDVERSHRPVRVSAPGPQRPHPVQHRPALPPQAPHGPPTGPALDGLRDDCWQGPWSRPRPPPSNTRGSLDDSSWSFPSPPKPSDALFWESPRPPGVEKTPDCDRDWLSPY